MLVVLNIMYKTDHCITMAVQGMLVITLNIVGKDVVWKMGYWLVGDKQVGLFNITLVALPNYITLMHTTIT